MAIPNTITKIIDKEGRIVEFEIERIVRSISATICDVTGTRRNTPELRARKYANLVTKRIYREFYDLHWLKSQFIINYLNYEPDERHRRLEHARLTERVSFLLAELFRIQTAQDAKALKDTKALRELVGSEIKSAHVDFKYTEGIIPQFTEDHQADIIGLLTGHTSTMLQRERTAALLYPDREYVQDMTELTLRDMGEVDIAEGYMIFREGKRKIRAGDISPQQFTNNGIHHELINRTMEWNINWECDSVLTLNDWIHGRSGKGIQELISAAEKRYHKDVSRTAEKILARRTDIRFIIIAGPSCSNKTTTTVIIEQALKKEGLKLKQLNIDNYFKNLKDQPKDEFGDYDFEMPEAIDIPLLNQHFEQLMRGQTIDVPYYNFKKGMRDGSTPFTLGDDEFCLIDCLHGLYSKLTAAVPMQRKFRIYIESMNVIRSITGEATRWSDVRMLKRMIRDYKHRGYSVDHTLAHWPYVRKGELKHIIPYIFTADAVLNAGLPYELPLLKASLDGILPSRKYIEKLRVQGRLDPYIRGIRLLSLLDTVADFNNFDLVPGTSPIREFIGGSTFIIPHND